LVLDEIINYIQSLQRQVEVGIIAFYYFHISALLKSFLIYVFFEIDFENFAINGWLSQFLSMKLEAVNSRLNSGIEAFPPKDVSLEHSCFLY